MEANSLAPKLRFKDKDCKDFPDWEFKRGNELFDSISNKKHNSDLPILAISQELGAVPREQINYKISVTKSSVSSYKIVEKGDFIISLRSFQGGIEYSNYKGICSPAYIILKSTKKINDYYFKIYFKTHKYIQQLTKKLEGIRDGKMISYKYFSEIKLPFPCIKEQNKIASFLTSVDKKINLLTKKKALLETYKKGVMQKIFSQEIRFKDDDGKDFPDWESKRLREYLIKHTEKSTENNQYPVLTSSRKGLFFQKDYFNGQNIASKDNTGYNVVPRGYFTYRHMSDDLDFKFNINHLCDRGIVSTLYPVFKTDEKLEDHFLLNKLNNGEEFKRYALLQKQGGSRTYMYFNKLEFLKLFIPHLKEQQKIVSFLSTISKKIELADFQLERNKEFKKGLLQQIFV